MASEYTITPFQQRVLSIPEEINLALLGGRGGGKSTACALLELRYGEQYQAQAKMLYVRKSYTGMRDFESMLYEIFGAAYPEGARYNQSEHLWRLPHGGTLELAQIESFADLQKMQGRSMGLIIVDECGQYASADIPFLLRANMRGKKGQPLRMVMCANPGSVGQAWLYNRFIIGRTPWKPFKDRDTGEWWMYCPSTLADNDQIDRDAYQRQLESACSTDPELLKAWLNGDFASQTGAYFGTSLDYNRNAVGPFTKMPVYRGEMWKHWLSHDFGSAAPSATYLMARSPGAEFESVYYPRDSIVVIDEYATYRRDDITKGLGWTAAITAEAIVEWCKPWKVKPQGVADDAIFASKTGHTLSIADEFSRNGVTFSPAKKGDRVSGWQRKRRMLANAGKPDVPGLYVSRSCEYFWQTVPFLSRDQKRIEDIDSSGPDHAADAIRYGLGGMPEVTVSPLRL